MNNPYARYTLAQLKSKLAELQYQIDSWDSYSIDEPDVSKDDLIQEYERVRDERNTQYKNYLRFKNYMDKSHISIGQEGWLYGRADPKGIKRTIKAFEDTTGLEVEIKTKRKDQEEFIYLVGVFE